MGCLPFFHWDRPEYWKYWTKYFFLPLKIEWMLWHKHTSKDPANNYSIFNLLKVELWLINNLWGYNLRLHRNENHTLLLSSSTHFSPSFNTRQHFYVYSVYQAFRDEPFDCPIPLSNCGSEMRYSSKQRKTYIKE